MITPATGWRLPYWYGWRIKDKFTEIIQSTKSIKRDAKCYNNSGEFGDTRDQENQTYNKRHTRAEHSDQRHFVVCIYIQYTKLLSRVWLFRPHGLYSPWNSPGQNTGVGSLSLFQGIFPTQGSNQGLLLCRQILYQLSYNLAYRKFEKRY